MFNCLFLKMAIETNNLEAVNMTFYQSDSKCSQVGAQSTLCMLFIIIIDEIIKEKPSKAYV